MLRNPALNLVLPISVWLAGIALPVKGAEQITGAFGVALSQTFNADTVIGRKTLHDGRQAFRIEPTKAMAFFSRYSVLVTSKSDQGDRVYAIIAEGDMEDDEECRASQQILMTLLEKKYGQEQENKISSQRYAAKRITQGEKYIETSCAGHNVTLTIRYNDISLENHANSGSEFNVEKLDASGL
ncbi:MAG: hypothetical protein KUG82_22670 [Pseudomonadales bacterium]|nr:hypothetical protein [Pseudomonadales bacterium]